MHRTARSVCQLLRLLSNEHRLLVLCQLVEGERTVGELAERLGMRQPAMSQQLARLRAEGIVDTRRDGQSIHYSLARSDVADLIIHLHDTYCAAGRREGDLIS
jgi:DNA-binding transcriptional ArsR family regulator